MIFVQIAAYRDPELLPTIQDCLAKARYPGDLRFGICWQRSPEDECLRPFEENPKFRIIDVPWQESRGLGWARSRIQSLYDGEDYTLQIDSHHRFAKHWDQKLLDYLELTGSAKPILTTYAGIYDPATGKKERAAPFKMVADRFTPSGTILFRPYHIPGWKELDRPVRARFVSGHFFFTLGRHCRDYRYDPDIYFAGDEISLSIRSFTLGFDLFHPHRTVIWHEYTREGRVKHWDDHVPQNRQAVKLAWHERDAVSKKRLRKMLREEDNDSDISGYDLGTERTHRDYELYAGIDFAGRRLHTETLAGVEPPCTCTDSGQWERCLASRQSVTLRWNIDDLRQCADTKFIYFGVEDASGNVLYRHDAPPESPEARLLTDRHEAELLTTDEPAKLVVWPVSRSQGWLKKIVYPL